MCPAMGDHWVATEACTTASWMEGYTTRQRVQWSECSVRTLAVCVPTSPGHWISNRKNKHRSQLYRLPPYQPGWHDQNELATTSSISSRNTSMAIPSLRHTVIYRNNLFQIRPAEPQICWKRGLHYVDYIPLHTLNCWFDVLRSCKLFPILYWFSSPFSIHLHISFLSKPWKILKNWHYWINWTKSHCDCIEADTRKICKLNSKFQNWKKF